VESKEAQLAAYDRDSLFFSGFVCYYRYGIRLGIAVSETDWI
jgi:hypothetical protein